MKIGILGGTFDPIHSGHILMAQCAKKEFELDRVMFLPNGNPPHKTVSGGALDKHRLKMTELAVSEYDGFFVSDYEIKKGCVCYSVDTVRHFISDGNKYYFIIGADSFYQIESWKDFKSLISLCTFIVAGREYNGKNLYCEMKKFNEKYNADFRLMSMNEIDISSTMIRKMIAQGQDIAQLVPKCVSDYIYKNNLYV